MDPNIISETTQSFPQRHPSSAPQEQPSRPQPRAILTDTTNTAPAQYSPPGYPVAAKPEVERDPSLTQVDLPSKFLFYPFKHLSVKPVRGFHQAKFSRAAHEKSNRHMADAISTLLSDGISAYDLTLPDYYWLLYFLRLTFYPKSQLIHKSVCTNPDHVLAVAKKEKSADTLITVTTISRTIIKDTELDLESVMKGFDEDGALRTELQDTFGLELFPTTVRDMVELESLYPASQPDNEEAMSAFKETEYLADYAGFVQGRDGGKLSLVDRIELVKNFPPHLMDLVEDYRNRISEYGAEENIKVTCGECGAGIETTVSISAHSFL